MSADPHGDLRKYLAEIDAPAGAYEHIAKVIGWRPPPLWEAPREKAEAINQTVVVPDGMRLVGWYCEHPLSNYPPYERVSEHREWANNKRGWKAKKNTSKSLMFGDHNSEHHCPARVPVFALKSVTA